MDNIEESFAAADKKSQDLIEKYVTDGFAESLARLVVYLDEEHKKSALQKLPEGVREKVEECLNGELAGAKRTDPIIMTEAARIHKKMGYYGETMADEVLEKLTPQERLHLDWVNDEHFERNPVLATTVENSIFRFEDIVMLDDRAIQSVLREVGIGSFDIPWALKDANPEVQGKIFRNLSKRAGAQLREDLEVVKNVDESHVEKAQIKIVQTILKLAYRGDIFICRFDPIELPEL